MKSDLEFVVEWAKQLESSLERNFGAVGRGLHEKTDSVANVLDPQTVRDLRYVASIRNKIVHEVGASVIDDRARFTTICERLLAAITQPNPPSNDNCPTSAEPPVGSSAPPPFPVGSGDSKAIWLYQVLESTWLYQELESTFEGLKAHRGFSAIVT